MKLQATKMTPLIITSIDAMRAFIDSSQPCFLCILQSLLHSIAPAALDDCLKMAAGSLCYTHPKPEHRGQMGLHVAARDTVNLRSNDVINLTGTGRKLSFRVQGRCMTAAFCLLMGLAPPLNLIQDQTKASLIRCQRIAVFTRIPDICPGSPH